MNNVTTLSSYNGHLTSYIQVTPQEVTGSVKKWIDHTLSYIQTSSRILEIGSAFGRDADYIETQGFTVQRSDAAESFVQHLSGQGHDAKLFNILTHTRTLQKNF